MAVRHAAPGVMRVDTMVQEWTPVMQSSSRAAPRWPKIKPRGLLLGLKQTSWAPHNLVLKGYTAENGAG